MKFATSEYVIDKKYAKELESKMNVFRLQTATKKTLFLTMVTTYGASQNNYFLGLVQGEVLMKDLFK